MGTPPKEEEELLWRDEQLLAKTCVASMQMYLFCIQKSNRRELSDTKPSPCKVYTTLIVNQLMLQQRDVLSGNEGGVIGPQREKK